MEIQQEVILFQGKGMALLTSGIDGKASSAQVAAWAILSRAVKGRRGTVVRHPHLGAVMNVASIQTENSIGWRQVGHAVCPCGIRK
jgi:hypothetical protein